MKIDDKVCTLEQSRRLVELGFKIDSQWYWQWYTNEEKPYWRVINTPAFRKQAHLFIPAPDVAELGKILPMEFKSSNGMTIFEFNSSVMRYDNGIESGWYMRWSAPRGSVTPFGFRENHDPNPIIFKTQTQALCAALIWIVENGYQIP